MSTPKQSKPSPKSSPSPELWRIPHSAQVRESKIWTEGAERYADGNWLGAAGDIKYQLERLSHAEAHLGKVKEALKSKLYGQRLGTPESLEDDIAKVRWFCSFLIEIQEIESREKK